MGKIIGYWHGVPVEEEPSVPKGWVYFINPDYLVVGAVKNVDKRWLRVVNWFVWQVGRHFKHKPSWWKARTPKP